MTSTVDPGMRGQAALGSVPNNLPIQLTSFVGRDIELDEIRQVLAGVRLLTLTGPGGSGKTRLGWQVAADLAPTFPDGVWWVELAELRNGVEAIDALAAATGVLVQPAQGPLRSLTDHLAGRRLLLCLDNAEHIVDDAARVAEAILRGSPRVTLLVTSREPLGVPGEAVWRVLPMEDDEAVALFVERARLVRPGFMLDQSSEGAVRSIATHLDGIPLALELAAAWLRTLTPQQIELSLDDRFTLLVRGPRGAQRRHQTLAGSIDWSHALLDAPDKVVFRRLAAFAGSFGLAGARAVTADEVVDVEEVLPALGRLVDKSLVVAEEHEGIARFRMLETIRAYAAARLVEAREETAIRDRHLAWAVAFVEAADPERLRDPDGWRRSVRQEYANLRAALERGLEAEDAELGRRLAAAMAWVWHMDRRGPEGIGYLRRAIDRFPNDRSRLQARLLTGLALVADTAGPLDLEYDAATRALELATEVGDESLRALCLNLAGVGAFFTDFDEAWALSERAYAAAQAGGNRFVLGGARALQAIILHLRDRHAEAEAVIDESVRDHLQLHRGVLSAVLGFQAFGALATGEPARAIRLAEEGLRIAEPLNDYLRVGAARSALAYVRTMAGDLDGAEAAIEPILRLLDGADAEILVPELAHTMGLLSVRRGALGEAVVWFARDAGSTDRNRETYLAARVLPSLGRSQAALGRTSEGTATLERAAAVAKRLGMPAPLADALEGQAELLATDSDRLERAIDLAHEALAERVDHGLRAFIPDSLESIARFGAQIAPSVDDVRVLAAAQANRESIGLPRDPARERAFQETVARLQAALGDEFSRAWAEGARLTLDEAVAYARRSRGSRGRPSTGWGSLTPTELEVTGLVAEGFSNPEIGTRLFMSRGTVKTHLSHIFTKLDVANRTELATLAGSRPRERERSDRRPGP